MAEDPLELETRRRIYDHLRRHPGAHMRGIGRDLDIPMGTLEYHLHYLVKAGLLVTREDGRYTRYFLAGELSRRDKDVLALLRQDVPRRIAAHLVLAPGISHGDLLAKFDLSASTLSFHLKKLVKAGLVEGTRVGRENHYRVLEPDMIGRVLVAHKASFLDDVVDRFASVWLSLEPHADPPEDEESERNSGENGKPGEENPAPDAAKGGGVLMVFAALASILGWISGGVGRAPSRLERGAPGPQAGPR